MNITFTQIQLEQILAESATARRVISLAISNTRMDKETTQKQVGSYVWGALNKIDAIKAIRNNLNAHDIYAAYPHISFNRSGTDSKLGLADSKYLVESIRYSF